MIDIGRLGFRRVVLLAACCGAVHGGEVSVAQASNSDPGGAFPAKAGSRAGTLPWCADSSTVTAILMHRKLVWLLTTDDADMADHRAGLASQPRLEPAEVTWVRDEALCAAASTQGAHLALTDSALAPLLLMEF